MKYDLMAGAAGLILGACALVSTASAQPTSGLIAKAPIAKAPIAKALADPRRPAADRARDPARHPAELIAFSGVKPGDRVADVFAGGGYFTRLLSDVVGLKGRVFAIIPTEMVKNCDPAEFAGARRVAEEGTWRNVAVVTRPASAMTPRGLDVIWSSQNYHDLHDREMDSPDVAAVDRGLFAALRPGRVLLVIDHAAQAGSGLRDTQTLHRIDPEQIRRELQAAGFVFDGESSVLRNPDDDHSLRVFDPKIRGRTDQVVLRFRRPAA